MNIQWRSFLRPTSLFGRGLLMILLPVLVLQLIVGTLVYQRYFDQVTKQLSEQVISEINFATNRAKSPDEFENILRELNIRVADLPDLSKNQFGSFDVSGRLIVSNFQAAFGEGTFIDSRSDSSIQVTLPFDESTLTLIISRGKLAPINPQQIMLNILMFSLVLVLLSILFLRNQIRSLRKLTQAAKAFGRGESVEYNPSGGDEIRSAGRSFLSMRNRISRQREHRNLMLSGVSHDLRTPLTRMKLSVEMLDDEESKAMLKDDIKAIEELADSFLSYASNDAPEGFQDIDIKDFLIMIAVNFSKMTTINGPNVNLRIKPVLFRRGIENLLSNAQRFANNIQLDLSISQRSVSILIDDDGPGIPQDKRDEAIKPFTRLDRARNQDQSNHVGLGMAIASDAIRQHGGTMKLEESPIGGLRIKIEIPMKIETI